jgi:PKD repeat protein
MKGTCNLKIFSTTMIFILMISIICIVNPTSQGYEESRAPGKDYEIVLDVPWRIKKGKDIPVLLIIHDADDARSLVRPNSIGVPIREIVVSIYDSEHKLLSNQTFNATELGGPMGSAALLITDETWTKEVIFSPSDFIGKGPDYMGNAEVEAVFSLLSGEEIRGQFMLINKDDLTSLPDWYIGETHSYSNYTDNDNDFGAPLESISRAGNCIDLDWLAITDDSSSAGFSDSDEFDERTLKMTAQNGILPQPLLIPAEEVICRQDNGGVGIQYGKLLVYGTGYIASTHRGSSLSAQEVIAIVEEAGGASYVEDLLSDNALYAPWNTLPGNLTGIEIWKGGDPYTGENGLMLDQWVTYLLMGKRSYALAGSGAIGEFDKLGKVRTSAFLPKGLTEENLVNALGGGHTILTNGPQVTFLAENENKTEFFIGENSEPVLQGKEITINYKTMCDSLFGKIEELTLHMGTIGENETSILLDIDEKEIDISSLLVPNKETYIRMSVKSVDSFDSNYYAMTNPIWVRFTNRAPVANAGEDQIGFVDEEVKFEGVGSDPDGSIIKYEWDFDGDEIYDWESSSGGKVDHVYKTENTYTASFRVTDEMGSFSVDNCTVSVTERPVNTAPVVDAGNDVTVEEGMEVKLTALAEDYENNIIDLEWSENGMVLSTSLTLKRVFNVGVHELVFTATDEEGLSGSDSVKVIVTRSDNVLPVAVLVVDMNETFIKKDIRFDGSDSDDPDGNIIRYNFDFGDGESTDWQEEDYASHEYSKAGTYRAFLQVMDDRNGISNSEEISILIKVRTRPPVDPEPEEKGNLITRAKDYLWKNKTIAGGVGAALLLLILIIIIALVKRKGKDELIFKKVDGDEEARSDEIEDEIQIDEESNAAEDEGSNPSDESSEDEIAAVEPIAVEIVEVVEDESIERVVEVVAESVS